DTHIGKKLQKAEGVIDGMLMMLDIKLELDRYVEKI
ncbi:TPA: antiterminator Q family protein, partial [Providencia alcalifaciens]